MNEVQALYFCMFFIVLLFTIREFTNKVELILLSIFSIISIIALSVIAENSLFVIIGVVITVSNMKYAYFLPGDEKNANR